MPYLARLWSKTVWLVVMGHPSLPMRIHLGGEWWGGELGWGLVWNDDEIEIFELENNNDEE